MDYQWIIALFTFIQIAGCTLKKCCEGENILAGKKCLEGSIINALQCPSRYLLKKEDVDHIDEKNGELSFGNVLKIMDEFCTSNLNGSQVFIVCYKPEDIEEPPNIFIYIGFVSSIFLFTTAAVYILLPKLLDLQGLCVVHSVLGLAFGFIIMGVNRLSDESSSFVCHFYAYSMYFCFLYAFFWLNTYSFHMWRITTQPKILANVERWKMIYHLYSCGSPLMLLLIVCFSQVSNLYIYTHPRMAEDSILCWFGTLEASFVYMYVPISVLLTMNVLYFFFTIYVLWKEVQQYDGRRLKIIRYRLSLCFKMFFVMGISWIFEVLSAAFEHKYPSFLWKISDTINSLQGILIFLVMVVLRKRVYRLLAEKSFCQFLPSTWRSIQMDEEEEEITDVNDLKMDAVNGAY